MNEELTKATLDLATRAQGLEVVDQATADMATEIILAGKGMVKKIKDFFAPLKRAQDEAKKAVLDAEKTELGKVEPIVDRYSMAVATWRQGEEKKRLEAENAARRAAEEHRLLEEKALKQALEAEQRAEEEKRLAAAEAKQKADAATLDVIAATTTEGQREAEARARAAREEGEQRQAEVDRKLREEQDRILTEAAARESEIAPALTVTAAPKTDGLAMRTYWKAIVVDFPQLIAAVATAQISTEALLPNMTFLNDMATRLKGQVVIPGVRMESEARMAKSR